MLPPMILLNAPWPFSQMSTMFSQLVKQMAAQEGITEQFKADEQMEWIGRMNTVVRQSAYSYVILSSVFAIPFLIV